MRLTIVSEGSRRNASYTITPTGGWPPSQADQNRLEEVFPTIERMTKRVLGDSLISLKNTGPALILKVQPGTSTSNKKTEINALFGWMKIFDIESEDSKETRRGAWPDRREEFDDDFFIPGGP